MKSKYNCKGCNRELIERYFDKCMYCGHPIPKDQQLSKSEKEAIGLDKEKTFLEQQVEHKNYMDSHKEKMKKGSEGVCGSGDGFEGGGGDC